MKTHNSNARYADDTFHSENNNIESNKAFGKLETVPWEKRTHQSTCVEDPVPLDLACLWVCARFYIRNHRMPSVLPVRLEGKKMNIRNKHTRSDWFSASKQRLATGQRGWKLQKQNPLSRFRLLRRASGTLGHCHRSELMFNCPPQSSPAQPTSVCAERPVRKETKSTKNNHRLVGE